MNMSASNKCNEGNTSGVSKRGVAFIGGGQEKTFKGVTIEQRPELCKRVSLVEGAADVRATQSAIVSPQKPYVNVSTK